MDLRAIQVEPVGATSSFHATGSYTGVGGHKTPCYQNMNYLKDKTFGLFYDMIDWPDEPLTDGCTTGSIFSTVWTSELDKAVTDIITGIAYWTWSIDDYYVHLHYDIRYMFMTYAVGL